MRRLANKLFLTAAATLLVGACSKAPQSSMPRVDRAVPVIVEPLRFESARTRIEAVGNARAVLSAEIHPAASGEVVAVNFEPGQFVKKGDVLVELDSREETLALQLGKVRLADAERLYERYSRSADSGAVLPTTMDAAETAMETARLELERARIALADRTIEAVFDGHVGVTEVDPGDRVNPDTMITTLDDRSSLLVSFEVPEAFIGEMQEGETIELETWSTAMPVVQGEVVDIGSRIDPRNRTFVTRARVDNSDDRLRPGMSFRVTADVKGERYAVVPETAVLWGADGAYLWSVVDGNATRVPVNVIQRREGRVLVDGDLEASDIVVVEGTQNMRNGVAVDYDEDRLARARQTMAPSAGASNNYSERD
jgi:membrane fusion protein (multidrug efflux system)